MGVSAGDAYLDVHSRLAAGFSQRLNAQVQGPVGRAGEQASHHFGRKLAAGLKGAAVIGVGALAGATAIAARGLSAATKQASDFNETVNKTKVIFGSSRKEIMDWSRGSARAMGLSRTEALANASAFGDMFLQLRIGRGQATDMSKGMVQLAADFASFHNADITQVLEAQQSAFRGEYDALQRFVPGINAARVEQEALRLTHKASAKDLTGAEKAQAAYNIMLKDGARARGDFANTSQQLANTQRIEKAQWADLQRVVGSQFLPAQLALHRAVSDKLLPAMRTLAEQVGPKVGAAATRWAQALGKNIPTSRELTLGIRALGAAYRGEGVTSDGFVGSMERLGVGLRRARELAAQLGPKVRASFASFREGKGASDSLGPSLRLSGRLFGFVADHADTLAKHLPLIVAAWVAYKGASAAAQYADVARVAIMPAQIAGQFALAKATRSLAAANKEAAGTTLTAAAAQNVANTAGKVSIFTKVKDRVVTLAKAAAEKIAAVATAIWTGIQWALNAALTANPIGIIIVAVGALIAGVIYAYKHFGWFRTAVQAVWEALKVAGVWVANLAKVIGGALAGAFGWLVGIGRRIVSGLWSGLKAMWEGKGGVLGWIFGWQFRLLAILAKAGGWLIDIGRKVISGWWNGMRAVWGTVLTWLGGLGAKVIGVYARAYLWLLEKGKDILRGLWNGLKAIWGAEKAGASTVLGWLAGIGGRIIGVFARAATWLVEKGKDVIRGLLAGIKSAFQTVKDWFTGKEGPAAWIKAHKGPISFDRGLLRPAGEAIMSGFLRGLKSGAKGAFDYVGKVAGNIWGMFTGRGAGGARGAVVDLGRRMAAAFGWVGSQWEALYSLWQGESGWNPLAKNPSSGAFGIPQALPASKMGPAAVRGDAGAQIAWGLRYIADRYGSPMQAWAMWNARKPHWYAEGGVFDRPTIIGVGEAGPEAVVPLDRLEPIGGRTINVYVDVAATANPADVGREVVQAIRAYERRSGTSWRTATA